MQTTLLTKKTQKKKKNTQTKKQKKKTTHTLSLTLAHKFSLSLSPHLPQAYLRSTPNRQHTKETNPGNNHVLRQERPLRPSGRGGQTHGVPARTTNLRTKPQQTLHAAVAARLRTSAGPAAIPIPGTTTAGRPRRGAPGRRPPGPATRQGGAPIAGAPAAQLGGAGVGHGALPAAAGPLLGVGAVAGVQRDRGASQRRQGVVRRAPARAAGGLPGRGGPGRPRVWHHPAAGAGRVPGRPAPFLGLGRRLDAADAAVGRGLLHHRLPDPQRRGAPPAHSRPAAPERKKR